jgi:hypothetical protein
MKIIKLLLILSIITNIAIANIFKNYFIDNKNTQEHIKFHKDILNNLYENIILNDINNTIYNLKLLKISINDKNIKSSKEYFTKLVSLWKSIEAFYILGDIDSKYIDIPRYIDIFNQGKEDIKKQLNLILKSTTPLNISLYKNSHKSINALEYILYKKDINKIRVNKTLNIIIESIQNHISTIYKAYKNKKESFLFDNKEANSIIINKLIESSYKLKSWRVGDVLGYGKKYKNNPNIKRSEYYISKNSMNSIKAILLLHKRVIDSKNFNDFGDYLIDIDILSYKKELLYTINQSLNSLKVVKNDDITKTKELYKNIKKLHKIYYIKLIDQINIKANILDADGD